jgi:hypothetical protein
MDESSQVTYQPPVSALLTAGDVRNQREWIDYPTQFGLSEAHVPELIRMLQDQELWWADSESDEVWANIHAWRALGQLRAMAALPALLEILVKVDVENSDWISEEIPDVLAMLGADALPSLQEFLADDHKGLYARAGASRAVEQIGIQYPEFRATSVAILTDQLRKFHQQDETLNAFLLSSLVDLNAVEAAPVMQEAFAAGQVDEMVRGDWEDVQIDLGLLTERITPARRGGWMGIDPDEDIETILFRLERRVESLRQEIAHDKRKKARKQAKATRQKQRPPKKRKRK